MGMRTPSELTVETVIAVGRLLCGDSEWNRKAWIADLYEMACPVGISRDSFGDWLVLCHREGSLQLSRMDVARQEESAILEASEVRYLNAAWHQVVVK